MPPELLYKADNPQWPGAVFYYIRSEKQPKFYIVETRIRTEDGKLLRETKDDCGNYKSVVINKDEFGFIPDCRLDLQIGKVRDNLLISM